MKFGGKKLTENIEKQMVRRLFWDGKIPGICVGTKAAAVPGPVPITGHGEES